MTLRSAIFGKENITLDWGFFCKKLENMGYFLTPPYFYSFI